VTVSMSMRISFDAANLFLTAAKASPASGLPVPTLETEFEARAGIVRLLSTKWRFV
jgi:hypothetical protein